MARVGSADGAIWLDVQRRAVSQVRAAGVLAASVKLRPP